MAKMALHTTTSRNNNSNSSSNKLPMARISGFHPEGPGSIPGMGKFFDKQRSMHLALVLLFLYTYMAQLSNNKDGRYFTANCIPYGLVARISGFHPEGPGSIPGMGRFFC
ncbi:hypothetical protein FF38_09793 [Lucilia cuprina]|uniref:Uncharacterized protein n=1 Tax=Lucilia cuprina TaxID=7375 RepID=A0A0L0BNX8_LUCCU|nr:hypothetical protein FF38_09793 [Lucilia cuprina]